MKKIHDVLCLSVYCSIVIICIVFPKALSGFVKESITLCVNRIVPSLFPFMFISNILSRTSISFHAGKCLAFIISPLFGIPKALSGAFLTGFFSGIPNGAYASGIFYSDGLCTKFQAERCIAVSNNCSIPFLITVAGIQLSGNVKNGLVLMLSQFISLIITTLAIRFAFPLKVEDMNSIQKQTKTTNKKLSVLVCKSITDTCSSMISVCCYITVFYIISNLLLSILPFRKTYSILIKGFFEMSTGVLSSSEMTFPSSIIACSSIIGFTGLSGIFQVTDAAEKYGLSACQYVFGRIINAIIMPVVTTILLILLPSDAVTAFSHYDINYCINSDNILYALLFASAMVSTAMLWFISSLKNKKIRYNKNKNSLIQKNIT